MTINPGPGPTQWVRWVRRGLDVALLTIALSPSSAQPSDQLPQFVDRAAATGLVIDNVSGTTQSYIVEGMMGGAAFFDYDNDGDIDLYVTNGSSFEGFGAGQHPTNRLYRNTDGTFEDVTATAAASDTNWSMGCAVADYDNDGDDDLYLTNYGANRLFDNSGGGSFTDASNAARVGHESWGTGCTFGDYDLDGDVDLYVANYVDFSRDYKSTIPCEWKNIAVYCGPRGLLPARDVLYRNDGDGLFSDQTAAAEMTLEYYGMAAIFADFDDDGWPDLFVADDTTPNMLYMNQGAGEGGGFAERALEAGVAYNGEGVIQGCMGAAVADYDNDGRLDLFVSNFTDEFNTLYRNDGFGLFSDLSFPSRVASSGRTEVAWGTAFFDFDNDGDRDLFVANGHTYPQADLPRAESSYKEKNLLFENRGDGSFADVSARAGPGLGVEAVSRGAALGDYDDDGDLDVFVLNLNGAPALLHNDGGSRGNYLLVRTVGTVSNRSGIGARISVSAEGRQQHAQVLSGGSYLSHHDSRAHFGLGQLSRVDSLVVRWPGGALQKLEGIAANQLITVTEPGN